MAIYPIIIAQADQSEITVGTFLGQTGLTPPFPDPDTRIPALIEAEGIVHYMRSGTRTVVTSADYAMQRGDFLTVPDQGSSGESSQHVAVTAQDYAFVVPSDSFGTNANNYMNRRPETTSITGINFLDRIMEALISGTQITTPINDVIIVSHANIGGALIFRLNAADQDTVIMYDELSAYVNEQSRPQITDRILRSDANLKIRGCNIGRATPFLEKLQQLFGGSVSVSAPKHIHTFSFDRDGQTTYRVESMSYCFTVYSKQRVANKNDLVELFRLNTNVASDCIEQEWASWIPDSIHTNQSAAYGCTSPVDISINVSREYRFQEQNRLYEYTVYDVESQPPEPSEPSDDESEEDESEETDQGPTTVEVLRNDLRTHATMRSSHPFPVYEQFSYESFDDFVDGISWQCTWNEGNNSLHCVGSRCMYELRVPITTEPENTLVANVLANSGQKRYIHQGISEIDAELFGIVSASSSSGSGGSSDDDDLFSDTGDEFPQ